MGDDSPNETVTRRIDEAVGFEPMRPKPAPAPKAPGAFPSRALRDQPGEAPFVDQGPVR